MRIKKLTIVAAFAALCSVSTVMAETYYVTSAAEVEALENLTAIDEVVWRDGEYADQIVKFTGPATLRAESDGGVIFTGKSYMMIRGEWASVKGFWWRNPAIVKGKSVVSFVRGTSNCVLENCAITAMDLPVEKFRKDEATEGKWVSIYGYKNTVRNCNLMEKRNQGCTLVVWFDEGITPTHTIEGNYFTRSLSIYKDPKGKNAANGQEAIRIGDSNWSMTYANCIVRGNHFHNFHGEENEIISNKSCGNLYEGNLITASRGQLTLRHGNDCVVRGNAFLGEGFPDGTGGVRIIGERHLVENNYMEDLEGDGYNSAICLVMGVKDSPLNRYFQVQEAMVRNNTIVKCDAGITTNHGSSKDQSMPPVTTTIMNNIVIAPGADDMMVKNTADATGDIEWLGNKIYGGMQEGVTPALEVMKVAPIYTRPTAMIERVRAESGVNFMSKEIKPTNK